VGQVGELVPFDAVSPGLRPGQGLDRERHVGEPEAFALEGVGGQVDGVGAGEVSAPVDGESGGGRLANGPQELPDIPLLPAEGGDDGPGGGGLVDRVVDAGSQDGVGTGLDEGAISIGQQCLDGVGEAYGPAEVGDPVPGVQGDGIDPGT